MTLPVILALLVLACTDDGPSDEQEGGMMETSGDGDGDPGDGDGAPGDGDGAPGDGDGAPGDGDGAPDDERIAAACEAACAVDAECGEEEWPGCAEDCAEEVGDEDECVLEVVVLFECLGTLDCEGYELYMGGDPFDEPDYPCKAEELVVIACWE